ncbi:hypothetical protein PMG11_00499 [Penicillium brasilianum]|uniref:Uncharacterized protein n=1 Tax=Penicillium brasilianum TaxID=104259 RepID=A0A0F7TGQ8_PENBI|nr:hypothetical protein PMG11_00499 [Penicillium brasilianum]
MKFPIVLSAVSLAGYASAFYGQMAASTYNVYEGKTFQFITLTDYNTGSVYQGELWGGFNACVDTQCQITFGEKSSGNYNFRASMWRTDDGCHNIDFQGGLDAHHGYCCGSLPCDFTA